MPYLVHEEQYSITPVFLWQKAIPEPVYRHEMIRRFHTETQRSVYQAQDTIPKALRRFWVKLKMLFRSSSSATIFLRESLVS